MSFPKDPANVEQSHTKLSSMAIIGDITENSCKIWTRLYCPATWWLVVSEQPLEGDLETLGNMQVDDFVSAQNARHIYCQGVEIKESTDNTHTFLVEGLQASKRYYYAVIADLKEAERIPRRTEIGYQKAKFFDSLPSDLSQITFGYFSCHDPFSTSTHGEGAWPHYYNTLVDKRALFSIGGGDQVYVDTNDKGDMYSVWKWLAKYKNAIIKAHMDNGRLKEQELIAYFAKIYRSYYRLYWNFNNLKKTLGRFPHYMIWDDHEIMDGWGSYSRQERRKLLNKLFQDDDENQNDRLVQLMFEAAKQVYFEYQHSHNPDTFIDLNPQKNSNCQWDYSFTVGSNGYYVLDMRGHHDYERAEEGNALLGDEQMERFQSWLTSVAGSVDCVFVVSPVPIVHWGALVSSLDIGPVKDDLRDEWEHESNHAERNKLLNSILGFSHSNNCPVTVMSGDVHSASAFQIENTEQFPRAQVFNVTSSAISRKPAPSKAEVLIKTTGKIKGYSGGYATRLYALSGEYNFLMLTTDNRHGELSVTVDICWPSGDDDELTRKRLFLVANE